jgi:hypothetical protein
MYGKRLPYYASTSFIEWFIKYTEKTICDLMEIICYGSVLKVYLRAVDTTIDMKPILNIDIRLICTPLHVPVFRDHHKVIYKYTSDVIKLSIKLDQFITLLIIL